MAELTQVPTIKELSDTGYVIVNDGEDVKQISKSDLMGQIANAKSISYDGSGSDITADNVQGAITEVKGKVDSLGSPVTYKGTVATYADLPTTHAVGDMYNVTADETTHTANMNYCWNGTIWDSLGATTDMNLYYTKTQTDSAIGVETTNRETAITNEVTARDAAIADKSLKNYSLTLAVADVVANTDEYATETTDHSAYPYCVNHAISGLTSAYEAHINYSSNLAVCDRSWQTFDDGTFRIYLKSMPTASINIEFTIQKGTVVA